MNSPILTMLADSSSIDDAAKAKLGDVRRSKRLRNVVGGMLKRPDATLPEALESEAEREGYYRLIASEHVAFEPLFSFHGDAAAKRAEAVGAEEILVLHDTSEFSWKIWDKEPSRDFLAQPSSKTQGFSIHLSMAVVRLNDAIGHHSPTCFAPLGYVAARPFVHQSELARAGGGTEAEAYWRELGGLYEKGQEKERWHENVEAASQRLEKATEAGTRLVHVMDREGDAYWLMSRMSEEKDRFLIRMTAPEKRRVKTGDRRIDFESLAEAMEGVGWSTIQKAEVGWRPERNASERKGMRRREGRSAKVRVRAKRIDLRRPDGLETWAYPENLSVWVVEVAEHKPPEGVEPIHWVLVTNLLEEDAKPTYETLWRLVGTYRARWLIEEGFDALKNECSVKELQHRSAPTLLNAIAIRCAIAWELLTLRVLAREAPELPAEAVVDPIRLAILRREAPRGIPKNPNAGHVYAAVARLGGHIRSNGPPGFKVLSRGWRKLNEMARGAHAIMREFGL